MTTYVPKGANRASHNARTAKAAQRTPLPPKASSKNDTAAIIRDEIGKQAAEAARSAARRVATAAAKQKSEMPPKVHAYLAAVREAGWEPEVTAPDKFTITITAQHDGEKIIVTFVDGHWSVTHRQVFVRRDGSEVLLRNASAAKKQMTPNRPIPGARKVARLPQEPQGADDPVKMLPFDPDEISDEELLALLRQGAMIRYRNSTSGAIQDAVLPPDNPQLRIEPNRTNPAPSRRAVHFLAADRRYRVVSLRAMLRCQPLDSSHGKGA